MTAMPTSIWFEHSDEDEDDCTELPEDVAV